MKQCEDMRPAIKSIPLTIKFANAISGPAGIFVFELKRNRGMGIWAVKANGHPLFRLCDDRSWKGSAT